MENVKIYAALIKARSEFKTVLFDKTNPHFKNKFSSLAAINDATLNALSKNGLAVIQPWKYLENGDTVIETIIIHESGESIKSSCIIKCGKTEQQFGSAVTYMRRYQLSSILGIVGEEDDDAEQAMQSYQKHVNQSPKLEPAIPKTDTVPPMGVDEFVDLLRKKTQNSYDFRFMEKYLFELEQTSGVKPIRVMMQALLPANTERFCNSWHKWYLELSQETSRN